MTCPACYAPLPAAHGAQEVTCEYCGTTIRLHRAIQMDSDDITPDGLRRIRDRTGRALVVAKVPDGWLATGETDASLACNVLPFAVHIELTQGDALIRATTANKYTVRRGMPGSPDMGFPSDRDLSCPSRFLDGMARQVAGEASPTLRLCAEHDFPEQSREWTEKEYARFIKEDRTMNSRYSTPVGAIGQKVARIYSFVRDGRAWGVAAYVHFTASGSKYVGWQSTATDATYTGIGGISSILSQFQERMKPRAPTDSRDVRTFLESYRSVDERVRAFATAELDAEGVSQEWVIHAMGSLVAPLEKFDDLYAGVFLEFIDDISWDQDTRKYIEEYQMQQGMMEMMQAQAMGQAMLAQNRAIYEAGQNMAHSMQETMDAQFEHYMATSDAQHRAFMDRQHAQFSSSAGGYGDEMSPNERFSKEAILEEADYVDQWGDTHTVSSHVDRAWIDNAGNVIGTDSWFDPGSDWTEMRKV